MSLAASISALWLGILTSISPCPLASNIAAVSFVGRRMDRPSRVLLSSGLYCAGRMAAYVALGAIIVAGLLSIPGLSNFLQRYLNKLLGPVLIVAGMFLLELIQLNLGRGRGAERMQARAEKGGVWTAALLGFVFALTFCPVSAALFFGSLIPLSLKHDSVLVLPSLYGLGTGLPVAFFAVLIVMGARSIGTAYNRLALFERWARRITGVVFILAGFYYTLKYVFALPLPI